MRVMVEADEVLWMDILQIYFIIFKIHMGDMRKTFYYSRMMLPKIYNYTSLTLVYKKQIK